MVAAGFLALAGPASGQSQFYGDKKYGEYFEEEKKWVELETRLPDFPKPENLIEFNAGAATRNRHFIDGTSLSVGEDGVVRYVVVVQTAGGTTNISYEGIRCAARVQKYYAFGRSDNAWGASRNREWLPIRPGGYQSALSRDYFCPGHTAILRADEGLNALRLGAHPEAK